jgi:hypothetical protein
MKRHGLFLFLLSIAVSSVSQSNLSDSTDNRLDSLFKRHFKLLDSAVLFKQAKRYYCCGGSINFMEEHTGIISSSEKTYIGKISFSISDLIKWHRWYLTKSVLVVDALKL